MSSSSLGPERVEAADSRVGKACSRTPTRLLFADTLLTHGAMQHWRHLEVASLMYIILPGRDDDDTQRARRTVEPRDAETSTSSTRSVGGSGSFRAHVRAVHIRTTVRH